MGSATGSLSAAGLFDSIFTVFTFNSFTSERSFDFSPSLTFCSVSERSSKNLHKLRLIENKKTKKGECCRKTHSFRSSGSSPAKSSKVSTSLERSAGRIDHKLCSDTTRYALPRHGDTWSLRSFSKRSRPCTLSTPFRLYVVQPKKD